MWSISNFVYSGRFSKHSQTDISVQGLKGFTTKEFNCQMLWKNRKNNQTNLAISDQKERGSRIFGSQCIRKQRKEVPTSWRFSLEFFIATIKVQFSEIFCPLQWRFTMYHYISWLGRLPTKQLFPLKVKWKNCYSTWKIRPPVPHYLVVYNQATFLFWDFFCRWKRPQPAKLRLIIWQESSRQSQNGYRLFFCVAHFLILERAMFSINVVVWWKWIQFFAHYSPAFA